MPVIDEATITLLTKILGMMGSNQDGEVLNAARKAHELVVSKGLTWPEVFAIRRVPVYSYDSPPPKQPPPEQPPPKRKSSPEDYVQTIRGYDWLELAEEVWQCRDMLNTREYQFIWDLVHKLRRLSGISAKQAAWLEKIFARVVGDF